MTLGTLVRKVDPRKALDLASPEAARLIAESKRNRARQLLADDVHAEIALLNGRAARLVLRAGRCKVASNGRRKAIQEAQSCQGMAMLLQKALDGETTPKLAPGLFATHHLERARRLFNQLQGA